MDNYSSKFHIFILFIGLTNAYFIDEIHEYTNSTIRRKRQTISKCTIPQYAPYERWLVGGTIVPPGTELEISSGVTIECQEGYRVSADSNLLECDSNWRPELLPKCKKLCPKIYSTATITVSCKDSNNSNIPCDIAIHGASLEYICSPFHEPVYEERINYCVQGEWTYPKPDCQPICGKKVTNKTLVLSYGGKELKNYIYPWVIALYINRYNTGFDKVNCGGTLVSRKVVLTAAHCVIDEQGNRYPKEKLEVAAGKLFNPYRDPRDFEWAQYRKVYNLIVHPAYKGESQVFAGDLAIIIVDKVFTFGDLIQPICINNVNNIPLTNGQMGEVAGWGITEDDQASDRLRVIEIPYKDKATCSNELPRDWEERYHFYDKICAGYYKRNISVCEGDSGSGLIFKNPHNKNRYYLHGIVSISPREFNAPCNYEQNALYTSTATYFNYIDGILEDNFVEDCILPPIPENGNRVLVNEADLQSNKNVLSTSVLSYTCKTGYKLSPPTPLLRCQDTYVPPTCNQMCEKITFPKNTQTYCKNRADQVRNCDDATNGWSITYTCPLGFETEKKMASSTKYCIRGVYGRPRPNCYIIGTVPDDDQAKPSKTDSDIQKVICTYASWGAYNKGIYPEDLDPNLCTHVVYASVGISISGELRVQDDELELDEDSRGLYSRVTDMKRRNKTLKVLLSVGGSRASNTSLFSSISNQNVKLAAFLKSAIHFIKTYNFDGLDIDWQYPVESEKENYMNFLLTIKNEFKRHGWLLSASVRSDLDGTGYNVPAMDSILDWVTIKSYDLYTGASKYTGNPNALFASSKENEWEKNHLNMDAIAKNWIRAGLSKRKLILSIAFYGRSFKLKSSSEHGIHAQITGPGPGVNKGFLRYFEICSKYTTNFNEEYDNDSRSPYKFSNNIWIGFNSHDAVWTKGEYIKKNGYGGVNVYPWDGDDNKGVCGRKHVLLKYVHGGLGNKRPSEID